VSARAVVEVYRTSCSRNTARLVALTLADLAASDGEGIVTRERLQQMTKLPPQRLERTIVELVELGELYLAFPGKWPLVYELRIGELVA
jgi:hypothetical protein